MKKCIYLFILVFSGSLVVHGQSKEEASLVAAIEIFRTGVVNADQDLLESITDTDLVYGHSSGKVQNKAEFIDEIMSGKPLDYATVELSDQTIKISDHIAVVRHIFSAQIINNGVAGNLKIGNMLIWKEKLGKWKLLARQAYKII
ncbi:nuclear transport factor 2 family protein [Arcticibacter eurypsychrophilus]|uniref:nuclear transport factor 2 family protein n=1 Tax=Arcticibacter eurypsychrophilus TaxID=1434752 RepID=UPI00084DF084|nr:nuclear transport factor 2 family protein [Arcticibacter eurypsychrophilus]